MCEQRNKSNKNSRLIFHKAPAMSQISATCWLGKLTTAWCRVYLFRYVASIVTNDCTAPRRLDLLYQEHFYHEEVTFDKQFELQGEEIFIKNAAYETLIFFRSETSTLRKISNK